MAPVPINRTRADGITIPMGKNALGQADLSGSTMKPPLPISL
jgi:hypothetical protein